VCKGGSRRARDPAAGWAPTTRRIRDMNDDLNKLIKFGFALGGAITAVYGLYRMAKRYGWIE